MEADSDILFWIFGVQFGLKAEKRIWYNQNVVKWKDCTYFSTIFEKTKKQGKNVNCQNIQTITCKNKPGKP